MINNVKNLILSLTPSIPHTNSGSFLVRTSDSPTPVFPLQPVHDAVVNNIPNLFVIDRPQLINEIRSNPDVPFFMNQNLRFAQQFRDRLQRELESSTTTNGYLKWQFDSINSDFNTFKNAVSSKLERVHAINEYVLDPSEETFTKVIEVSPLVNLLITGKGKELVRYLSTHFGSFDPSNPFSCFQSVGVIFQMYVGLECDQISWLRQSSFLIFNFGNDQGGVTNNAFVGGAFKRVLAGVTLGLLNNFPECLCLIGYLSPNWIFFGQNITDYTGFIFPLINTGPFIMASLDDPTRSFIFNLAAKYVVSLTLSHTTIVTWFNKNYWTWNHYFRSIYNFIDIYRMQMLDFFKSLFFNTSPSGSSLTIVAKACLTVLVIFVVVAITYYLNFW